MKRSGWALLAALLIVLWVGRGMREQAPPKGDSSVSTSTVPPVSKAESSPRSWVSDAKLSEREFAEFASRTLEKLPTRAALEDLTDEEVHGTPEVINQAGEELAKIARLASEQPELRSPAFRFYRDCAQRSELILSIRALCLSNARTYAPAQESMDEESIPANVRAIADRLSTQ